MANVRQHLDQWEHNRAFLLAVAWKVYPDWVVTAAFYTSLHAIDALLAHDNVSEVHSHQSRNLVLAKTNRYSAIWRAYQPLYDLSRTVRYLAQPAKWTPPEELQKNIIERYLYPIEKSVRKLAKVDLNLPPISLHVA